MKLITKYVSFDGVEHDDPESCKRHEKENFAARLVGLTAEQIAAALAYETTEAVDGVEIAEAIENARRVIFERRRELGIFKRARNGTVTTEPLKITHEPATAVVTGDADGAASVSDDQETEEDLASEREADADAIAAAFTRSGERVDP